MIEKFMTEIERAIEEKRGTIEVGTPSGAAMFSVKSFVFLETRSKKKGATFAFNIDDLAREAKAEILKHGPERLGKKLGSIRACAYFYNALEFLGGPHYPIPGVVRQLEIINVDTNEKLTWNVYPDERERESSEAPEGFRFDKVKGEVPIAEIRKESMQALSVTLASMDLVAAYFQGRFNFSRKYKTTHSHYKTPRELALTTNRAGKFDKQKLALEGEEDAPGKLILRQLNVNTDRFEAVNDLQIGLEDNRQFSIYDRIALFDVLSRLCAMKAINSDKEFIVVRGRDRRMPELAEENLDKHFVVTSKLIAKLTGIKDKTIISRIKHSIVGLAGLQFRVEQTLVNKKTHEEIPSAVIWELIRRKRVLKVGKAAVHVLQLDQFQFRMDDYITLDVAAFSRISELGLGKRAPKVSDLYTSIMLKGGGYISGKRQVFMNDEQAAEAVGTLAMYSRGQKAKALATFEESLKILFEAGLIERYGKQADRDVWQIILGG